MWRRQQRREPRRARGRVVRRQEHDRQRVEEIGLVRGARLWQLTAKGHSLEAIKDLGERRALGDRPPQHLDHLLDSLGSRVGVSSRPALAEQKADVPDDAVADLAESRQMNEESLLEQRRQRAVEVGRLRKLPEFLDQPRRRISGTKEIGEDAETIDDLTPETKRARLLLGQFMRHSTPHLCGVDPFSRGLRDSAGNSSECGRRDPGLLSPTAHGRAAGRSPMS